MPLRKDLTALDTGGRLDERQEDRNYTCSGREIEIKWISTYLKDWFEVAGKLRLSAKLATHRMREKKCSTKMSLWDSIKSGSTQQLWKDHPGIPNRNIHEKITSFSDERDCVIGTPAVPCLAHNTADMNANSFDL